MTGMASMTDPLSVEQQTLVHIVARAGRDREGRLPTKQWVLMQLQVKGLDGDAVLRAVPTWPPSRYQPIRIESDSDSQGRTVERIGLTVLGRHHAGDADSQAHNEAFVAGLAIAVENQLAMAAGSPYEPLEPRLNGAAAASRASISSKRRVQEADLVRLFAAEPATWSMLWQAQFGEWDTTGAWLWPFRGVTTTAEYLAMLEQALLAEIPTQPAVAPDPMALPEAFDHLDLAWRLIKSNRLIDSTQVVRGASLMQAVTTAEQFESRCSAVKDILDRMNVPAPDLLPANAAGWKSLRRLQHHISALDRERAATVVAAVKVLQNIALLRDAQQHGGMGERAASARTALGLSRFTGTWAQDWATVQVKAIEALRILREVLVSALPD